jgi:hypothetical protein
MKYHGEKIRTKHEDEEGVELNIYTKEKLLSFTSNVNNISLEIKPLQRTTAILAQDLPKIIRDQHILLKEEEY